MTDRSGFEGISAKVEEELSEKYKQLRSGKTKTYIDYLQGITKEGLIELKELVSDIKKLLEVEKPSKKDIRLLQAYMNDFEYLFRDNYCMHGLLHKENNPIFPSYNCLFCDKTFQVNDPYDFVYRGCFHGKTIPKYGQEGEYSAFDTAYVDIRKYNLIEDSSLPFDKLTEIAKRKVFEKITLTEGGFNEKGLVEETITEIKSEYPRLVIKRSK